MRNKNTVCFIGGDERQKYAAESLAEHININTVGEIFTDVKHSYVKHFENPLKAICGVDAIVLPLPAASCERIISFTSFTENLSALSSKALVLGGRFSPYLRGLLEDRSVKYVDYYENESFALRNAYLTAEGAVQLAMGTLKKSLGRSKIAIIGYGRIGKALGSLLSAFHADTTVFARRHEVRVLAEEEGLKARKANFHNESIFEEHETFDVIFNTVPERIIPNELLISLPEETAIIELASPPGGFDADIAVQSGIEVINGRGLPGKYAPETAGRIVAETVLQYLIQEEIL